MSHAPWMGVFLCLAAASLAAPSALADQQPAPRPSPAPENSLPPIFMVFTPATSPAPAPAQTLAAQPAAPAGTPVGQATPQVRIIDTPNGRIIVQQVSQPQPAAASPAAPRPGLSADAMDASAELSAQRAQQQAAAEQLSHVNPMGDEPSSASQDGAFGAALGSPVPGTPQIPVEQIERLRKLLSHPVVQGYLKVVSQPQVIDSLTQIAESPSKSTLFWAELACLLAWMIFRSWRGSLARSWLHRAWVGIYSLAIYLPLSAVLVPWVILGDPYVKLVSAVISAI